MLLNRNKKMWLPILIFFLFGGLLFLMDSCLQFRMSKSEIDQYFKTKKEKGTVHQFYLEDRRVNYLTVGDSLKPMVVFVHGSPGSLSAFIDFMADTALLSRAQLISVDRPGFGYSNFGFAEPSLEKQAAYVMSIIVKQKGNRRVILVGHSLGGPVICRVAIDYPESINGLVIVAGSIAPDLEPKEWFRAPLATPFLSWMVPRSLRASNKEIYKLKPQLEEMIPLYPKIKASTIVIQGGKDDLVHPGNADFAKKMITNAPVQLVLRADMNHFVPWTHPELIREAVIALIDKGN
jgi:pimeloyl-ACP methyl ester carboxylesterase